MAIKFDIGNVWFTIFCLASLYIAILAEIEEFNVSPSLRQSSIEVNSDGGYKGIIVRIHPYWDANTSKLYLSTFVDALQGASWLLYNATRGQVFFSEVTFLLPKDFPKTFITDINKDWKNATWEVFHDPAFLLYSDEKPATKGGDRITTQQPRGCGQPGDYIQVPISVIQESQNKNISLEHLLVHHWAKLRYGVFEESVSSSTSDANDCYFDGVYWKPTGCYKTSSFLRDRYANTVTGIQECKDTTKESIRSWTNSRHSIMYFDGMKEVDRFCGESEESPHNWEAPTKHNILCEENSVWDVIKKSPDFDHSSSVDNPTPLRINTVQEQPHQYLFIVQDISSSPSPGNEIKPIDIFYNAVYRFVVHTLNTDTNVAFVGLSENNGGNFTIKNWTKQSYLCSKQMMEEGVRNLFTVKNVTSLDTLTWTMERAISEMIKSFGKSSTTVVVLLSEDIHFDIRDYAPFLDETLKPMGIRVHFIFLSDKYEFISDVDKFAYETGGSTFSVKFKATESMSIITSRISLILDSIQADIPSKSDGLVITHPAQKYRKLWNGIDIYGSFSLPKDCSENDHRVVFSLSCDTWISGSRCPNITSDNNTTISIPMENIHAKTFTCMLPGTEGEKICSKSLDWHYHFNVPKDISFQACSALLTVTTPKINNKFISLRGKLSTFLIRPLYDVLIIYGELKKGLVPVLDARMDAVILLPNGDNITRKLKDNGNGDPDISKDDGIYTSYFTEFEKIPQKGRYSVLLSATVGSSGKKAVTYSTYIGSFYLLDIAPKSTRDRLPPNRITDVQLVKIDPVNREVQLKWTAPGDDYDNGEAVEYDIRYSTARERLSNDNFRKFGKRLTTCEKPQKSGSTETCSFSLPPGKTDHYYIAIQARDEAYNFNKVSNIVTVVFGDTDPNINPEPEGTTNGHSTSSRTDDVQWSTRSSTQVSGDSSHQGGKDNGDGYDRQPTPTGTPISPTNEQEDVKPEGVSIAPVNKREFIILAGCLGGAIILLLIIIIVLICILCSRCERRNKISKKTDSSSAWSLRPEPGQNELRNHFPSSFPSGASDDTSHASMALGYSNFVDSPNSSQQNLAASTRGATHEFSVTHHFANPALQYDRTLTRSAGQHNIQGSELEHSNGFNVQGSLRGKFLHGGSLRRVLPDTTGSISLSSMKVDSQPGTITRESNQNRIRQSNRDLGPDISPSARRRCIAGQSPYATTSLVHNVPKRISQSEGRSDQSSAKVNVDKANDDGFFDLGIV